MLRAGVSLWHLRQRVVSCVHHQCRAPHCRTVASAVLDPSGDSQLITSTANDVIKQTVRLRTNRRFREQQQMFVLTGLTLLKETALALGGQLHARLLIFPASHPNAPRKQPPGWIVADRVIHVSEPVMKKVTGLEDVAGIDAVATLPTPRRQTLYRDWQPVSEAQEDGSGGAEAAATPPGEEEPQRREQKKRMRRLLALEAVQDPGNLGTLVRRCARCCSCAVRHKQSAGHAHQRASARTHTRHAAAARWRLAGTPCTCCPGAATPSTTRPCAPAAAPCCGSPSARDRCRSCGG